MECCLALYSCDSSWLHCCTLLVCQVVNWCVCVWACVHGCAHACMLGLLPTFAQSSSQSTHITAEESLSSIYHRVNVCHSNATSSFTSNGSTSLAFPITFTNFITAAEDLRVSRISVNSVLVEKHLPR